MNQLNKGKAKYILVWTPVLLLLAITLYCSGNGFYASHFHSFLTNDTIPEKIAGNIKVQNKDSAKKQDQINSTDSLKANKISDTNIVVKADTLGLKFSKDSLDAPVVYHADDSMVMDIPSQKIILYGKKTQVNYLDNELTAPRIEFDQKTNLMTAYLVRDSSGNVISYPGFKQGDLITVSDSIKYNPKTGKGITKGTYTKQDEIYFYGEKLKKVDAEAFYVYRGRFTTCNLDTPHFAFVSRRIKYVNKKMAITGPVHPEVESVPIPIYLPFGIYPLRQGRHSGLLAPTFTANEQLGLALEGLGYYKILSQQWDIILRGTLYSYGGWTANISPRYYKRYHYQGNFGLDIQHLRDLDKAGARNFNIRWSHASDSKARPGVSFNASLNAGSSGFNSSVPNSPQRNFQNQLNSSITYSKIWKDKPFNLMVSGNHNQNTNTKQININLPDIGFNVNTLYPFRRKEVIGNYKWFENIGVALNTNVKSMSSFYDTAGGFLSQFLDKYQWGANHNVPISLSLPQIGNFQFAPSVSYQERWFQEKFIRSWNPTTKKLDTTIKKGFYTAREMNFGMGASTRIFGMFTFKKNSRVQAVRHEIRPTISANYKPDMNKQFWYTTQIDTVVDHTARYSVHERGVFGGGFGEGKFGGLSFGIDNNLQMKLRNKKDTGEAAIKKITLIDGFSINSSYNFLEDSFKLKPFNLNFRTNLFEKISITGSAIVVPYLTDANGDFIDKLIWNKKIALGKLTSANIAIQSQFHGGDKNEKLPVTNQQQQVNPISGLPLDEYQQEAAYISNNPGEYANFNIPWSISFSYSFYYQRQPNGYRTGGYSKTFTQNVNWSGSLNLTSKWQIGLNGYYNITEKQLGSLSMYLSREMHCWQMAINISPVGKFRSFNISISPKSSILRDLRINRTRYFYDL